MTITVEVLRDPAAALKSQGGAFLSLNSNGDVLCDRCDSGIVDSEPVFTMTTKVPWRKQPLEERVCQDCRTAWHHQIDPESVS